MNNEKPKKISYETYLAALGLFSIANKYYRRGQEMANELAELLNYPDSYMGHISDVSFDDEPKFDEALGKEGFLVARKGLKREPARRKAARPGAKRKAKARSRRDAP